MKKKTSLKKSGYGDFHLHSDLSGGGTLNPFQLIERVAGHNNRKKDKITHISLVDHNTVEGIEKAQKIGKRYEIEVVPGIEIKTKAPYYPAGVDILGYMIDITNRDFKRDLVRLENYRGEWILQVLNALNKELKSQGINRKVREIDIQASTKCAVPKSINEIAKALVKLGIVDDQGTAMRKYFDKGRPADIEFELPGAGEVIGIIRDAGGEAVIAHPIYYGPHKERNKVIKRLIDLGADGIEAYHTDHNARMTWEMKEIAKKHKLTVYGGSDFHGPDKYPEYSRGGRYHQNSHEGFFYGNIRSSFPRATIGKVKLPKKYTKIIAELWEKKQKG